MKQIELSAGTIDYEDGRRLAELIPQGRLAEVEDSYTLIPLDQPAKLAQIIREFTPASVTT
jgi:hypothetical protein